MAYDYGYPDALDEIARLHDYNIHIPSRTIFLSRSDYIDNQDYDPGVDHVFATNFLKNLLILETISSRPITIILNTPGGFEVQGMSIYDAIKQSPCHITIIVRGEASSMGSYILQAADNRVMAPSSIVMVHMGSSNGIGLEHKISSKRWLQFEEKYGTKMDKILKDRILEKNPRFSKKQFDNLIHFDTILTAEEAINLGLADEILDET